MDKGRPRIYAVRWTMLQRLGRHVTIVSVLLVAVWAVVLPHLSPDVLAQQGPNRAALVVRFSDGNVQTACVSFDTPTISGAELLTRSGIQASVDYNSGLGGAVCSLNSYGCAYPSQDCFCQCQGIRCEYWAYYHWSDNGWHYSQEGAGSYQVTNGDLEGWSWGPGNFSSGTEPPRVAFTEVCSESAPPAAGSQPRAGSLLVPVVHAQENLTTNSGAAPAASSPPDNSALLSGYVVYLLFAVALFGSLGWVLSQRKGRQAALRAGDPGHK